eukprot:3718604-Prymnesium_polylepis.1
MTTLSLTREISPLDLEEITHPHPRRGRPWLRPSSFDGYEEHMPPPAAPGLLTRVESGWRV